MAMSCQDPLDSVLAFLEEEGKKKENLKQVGIFSEKSDNLLLTIHMAHEFFNVRQ